ncbi:hypothetical protein HK405_000430, partial [Cladochytrium tenue]
MGRNRLPIVVVLGALLVTAACASAAVAAACESSSLEQAAAGVCDTDGSGPVLDAQGDGGVCDGGSVLDKLRSLPQFSRLAEAVEHSGGQLRDELGRDGLTLFAPTDAAIKASEAVGSFGDIEDEVLLYHVVPDERLEPHELHNGRLLPTLHREEELGGRPQLIRVARGKHGLVFL